MQKSIRKRAGAKLALVLLSTFLFLLLFAPVAMAQDMGDINADGEINVQDVVLVMQHVLNLETLTAAQQGRADVNGDSLINVQDVTLIMQFALGLIDEFPVVALQVTSITAVNARQVEVVFNTTVTAAVAQNPANYEVYKQGALFTNVFGTAAQGAVASLQADGRTVRLTLNEGPPKQSLVNGSNFNRVVVKAAVGLTADHVDSAVEFLDTTAPTFVSVRSVGASTIELTFSEPVKTISDPLVGVRLSDGINPNIPLDLANPTFHDPTRTLRINLSGMGVLTPGATYTVSLLPGDPPAGHNLEDYVNLRALPSSRLFTHTPVISTPTVSAAAINEKTVRLTFDRPVSMTAATDNAKFRLNFNIPGAIQRDSLDMNGFGDDFEAAMVTGSGGTQYDVQFASLMTAGSNTLYIHYTTNDDASGRIADGWGNVVPNNTSVNFNVVASTTPVIVHVRTVATNQVAITYSRNVTKNATTPEQFELFDGFLTFPGTQIVSNVGNEIVVQFGVAPFSAGDAEPTYEIRYEESAISTDRVRDTSTGTHALSPDMIVGIASGF
jgi:hypothetical protein